MVKYNATKDLPCRALWGGAPLLTESMRWRCLHSLPGVGAIPTKPAATCFSHLTRGRDLPRLQEAKTAPAGKKAAEGDVMSKGDLGEMENEELGGELGD
jgi:hypothetical protein